MATYKFYQHKETWFYLKRPGFEQGKEVDAHVMDTVLGITGSREVIVILPARNPGDTYQVRINNGFIIEAELHDTSEVPSAVTEFYARDM